MTDSLHFQPTPDWSDGRVWPELYDDLRRLAAAQMRGQADSSTLQPTALVNEAFLKLSESTEAKDRAHFIALASTAMRHILVDYARARGAEKRGGHRAAVTLNTRLVADETAEFDALAVEDALCRLSTLSERQARIVELRVFGGLSIVEAAEVVGLSERTVRNEWTIGSAWLKSQLSEG